MPRRTLAGLGLAMINRLAQTPLMRSPRWRRSTEALLQGGAREGFRLIGAAQRGFKAVRQLAAPARLAAATPPTLFDLTPSEEQQMLVEAVRSFAEGELRPAAGGADRALAAPEALLAGARELGLHLLGLPESLGGAGQARTEVTQALVAEALAWGDLGLAVACLGPQAVSQALVYWGSPDLQATYLPAFVEATPPVASFALSEPQALFDPLAPATRAQPEAGGYRLDGEKALVVRGAEADLFLVGAVVPGEGPALFLVERSPGLSCAPEPAMGLRAASTVRLRLDGVRVPAANRLGGAEIYAAALRRSRLAWCALSCGTARAVLDFVTPYVNERQAFGEPISHRQSVAFLVADMATELEGLRLVTLRAVSRAEQDLDHARETALARRLASRHAMRIGSDGVQLLGGHGYTQEYPVERWYRDLRAAAVMDGVVLL